MDITKADLAEALTGFRLGVTERGHGPFRGEVDEPDFVAGTLHATLSRIATERAPDPAGPPDDPDAMVTAVLDVLAPYVDPPFEGAGFSRIRVPVFLLDYNGQAVVPAVEGARAMAEQIVTAIRTASGPSPLESA